MRIDAKFVVSFFRRKTIQSNNRKKHGKFLNGCFMLAVKLTVLLYLSIFLKIISQILSISKRPFYYSMARVLGLQPVRHLENAELHLQPFQNDIILIDDKIH